MHKDVVCFEDSLPEELRSIKNPQTALPAIAKDRRLTSLIEQAVYPLPTRHDLHRQDARTMKLEAESVHLVVTSPPYWTLKEYRGAEGQLGHVEDYWIMGRIDDVINVAGRRLSTIEVESALVSHPKAAEAAAIGRPDEIKGQAIAVFVTIMESEPSSQDVSAAVDALPTTSRVEKTPSPLSPAASNSVARRD